MIAHTGRRVVVVTVVVDVIVGGAEGVAIEVRTVVVGLICVGVDCLGMVDVVRAVVVV